MKPRRQELWQRLIEATLESISIRGFQATTVAHITDIAGVSRTQFYFLFQDKDECFLATQSAAFGEFETRLRAPDYRGQDWPGKIRLGVDAAMQLLDESKAITRVLLVESAVAGQEAEENHQLGISQLSSFIEQGRELSPDSDYLPEAVGEMALGSAIAILNREIYRGKQPNFRQIVPSVCFALLLPFLGGKGAAEQVDEYYPGAIKKRNQS